MDKSALEEAILEKSEVVDALQIEIMKQTVTNLDTPVWKQYGATLKEFTDLKMEYRRILRKEYQEAA